MASDSTQAWHHERVTRWYDTHVHLDRYAEPGRTALLERAASAGVVVFAVATDIDSSTQVVKLLGSHRAIAGGMVGTHPKNASRGFEGELSALACEPGVVAIGECGFDGDGLDWALQSASFLAQCEIARTWNLSLGLHIDGTGAWEQLIDHESALEGLRVVRHYFTGDGGQAAWHRERGHYLSFGNPLLRRPQLQDTALRYPQELLLIETDSYPLPGRGTEPAQVVLVGEKLARLRGWPVEDARAKLQKNTKSAFRALPT